MILFNQPETYYVELLTELHDYLLENQELATEEMAREVVELVDLIRTNTVESRFKSEILIRKLMMDIYGYPHLNTNHTHIECSNVMDGNSQGPIPLKQLLEHIDQVLEYLPNTQRLCLIPFLVSRSEEDTASINWFRERLKRLKRFEMVTICIPDVSHLLPAIQLGIHKISPAKIELTVESCPLEDFEALLAAFKQGIPVNLNLPADVLLHGTSGSFAVFDCLSECEAPMVSSFIW